MKHGKKELLLVGFLLIQLVNPIQSFAQSPVTDGNLVAKTVSVASKPNNSLPALSSGAQEVANLLGIMPLITEYYSLPATERGEEGGTMSLHALTLRQKISEAVMTESLEIDGVLAEIDDEIAKTNELRSVLESRRDHKLAINNIINFIATGGIGIVGNALQLTDNFTREGTLTGIGASGFSIFLSLIGLRQQKGGKKALELAPNMLAVFFNRTPEYHSEYPEDILQYLNNVPPTETSSKSRKENLIKQWSDVGRIDLNSKPKSEEKIDLLTTGTSKKRPLTIDVLMDRTAMLDDVRAQLSLMKRDLSKLMLAIKVR
jgi:hypothetical protein